MAYPGRAQFYEQLVRKKKQKKKMQGRNIRSGQDLNQGCLDEKLIP